MNRKILALGAAGAVAAAALGGYKVADTMAETRIRQALEATAGKLGTGEQLTWDRIDAEPIGGSGVVEGLTYTRPDGYRAHVAAARGKGVSETGIDEVTFTGISITAPGDGEVAIQSLEATGLTPLPQSRLGAADEAAALVILGSLNAERVAVTDITFGPTDGSATIGLGAVTAEAVANGRYGRVTFSDLTGAADDGSAFGVGAVTLTDLDLTPLATLDEGVIQAALGGLLGVSAVTVEKVEGSGFGEASFTVDKVTLDGLERLDGTLVSSRLRVDHVKVPAALVAGENPALGKALASLGRDTLDTTVDVAQRFVADGGAFTLGPLRVRGEGLGEAVLKADFRGVPLLEMARAVDAGDFTAAQIMAGGVSFAGATLTYTDDRLADVLVDEVAGGDRAAFAEQAAAAVFANAAPGVPGEEVAMIAEAVRAFLTGTGGFTVSMAPEQPVLLPLAVIAVQQRKAIETLALKVEGH